MARERYGVDDDEVAVERVRLTALATARDPKTVSVLERIGVAQGWTCLEVGAGSGSISAWLGERVGPEGHVVSTDIDLRFHEDVPANVEVRRHDVTADPLETDHFDLVHVRAVLQHVPERDAVLQRLVGALRPGGWLVVEDSAMHAFAHQPLPEPLARVHRLIALAATTPWRDPDYGVKVLAALRALGLVELEVLGDSWIMRPGEPSGDWWFLALERAATRMVAAGALDADAAELARRQIAEPGFAIVSSLSLATWGRRPLSGR